jgi:hypothetical protein
MLTRAPPPCVFPIQPAPRPVMVAAAPLALPLPTSPALPLRGVPPVAARPISHRPALAPVPSVLLSPPRTAASSRPPADDVPDGESSHLLAVPVPAPMDPGIAEDAAVAKQVSDPPPPSFALRSFPSAHRSLTIVGVCCCRCPKWRRARRSGISPARPTSPYTSCSL